LKENRHAVNALITKVFDDVSSGNVAPRRDVDEEGNLSAKRKRRDSDDGAAHNVSRSSLPSPKKAKKPAKKHELTDEEIARQLSSEINSSARRAANGKARGATNGASKKGKRAKSSEIVDTDEEGEGKGTKRGRAKGGFSKEYILRCDGQHCALLLLCYLPVLSNSEPLAAVIGVDKLSRPQVVKQLWRYIKSNDLQNPQNKKEILCDGGLKAVFHADKVDSFKMNKVLSQCVGLVPFCRV
jgi:upstream activation factor subunit UAF30